MRIGIVGAGPAGLSFALLMKQRFPAYEIRVVEQNPAGATYGWGVVFSGRAISFLERGDADLYADLQRRMQTWDDQIIVHDGQPVRIDGYGFAGIARLELLQVLQEHCRRAGVTLRFGTRMTDLSAFAECDLIVGADGVNSVVRQLHAGIFQPSVGLLSNRYVWYGTHQRFEALSLIFRQHADGVFVAHTYPYSASTSTFIVECDAATYERAGFARMSAAESARYCEAVFAADLGGHGLLLNKSQWLQFKVVSCARWSHQNVVLLGDALRTIHFSIGSGTRMALEDALALFAACTAHEGDVPAALRTFEEARRPSAEQMLAVAAHSYDWYERFREKMALAPLPFAYDYMTRGGHLTHQQLQRRAPRFVAAYDAYLARK